MGILYLGEIWTRDSQSVTRLQTDSFLKDRGKFATRERNRSFFGLFDK